MDIYTLQHFEQILSTKFFEESIDRYILAIPKGIDNVKKYVDDRATGTYYMTIRDGHAYIITTGDTQIISPDVRLVE